MTKTNKNNSEETLKPYLLRSFYDWTVDHQLTALLTVQHHPDNSIPETIQTSPECVFSISPTYITDLSFEEDYITFSGAFLDNTHNVKIHYSSISSICVAETSYCLHLFTPQEDKPTHGIISPKIIKFSDSD